MSSSFSRLPTLTIITTLSLLSILFSSNSVHATINNPNVGSGGLIVNLYTASQDCTGVYKAATYSQGQCVHNHHSKSSAKYYCNDTHATIITFPDSINCDDSSGGNSINNNATNYVLVDNCTRLSDSSSWKFLCGTGRIEGMMMIVVVVLMSVLLLF
jgi:hypothetical protein